MELQQVKQITVYEVKILLRDPVSRIFIALAVCASLMYFIFPCVDRVRLYCRARSRFGRCICLISCNLYGLSLPLPKW